MAQVSASYADVIFTIENAGLSHPARTWAVNVFGRVDAGTYSFTDYSLAIDIGGNNAGAPGPILVTGLTFNGTPLTGSPAFPNILVSQGAIVPDSDIYVNGNLLAGPAGVLTTSNQLLFTLHLDAANNLNGSTTPSFSVIHS